MADLLHEIHPGDILLEDFMKPMGISAKQLAADIGVSLNHVNELIHGNSPMPVDTAMRLGLFFNIDGRFWINLQAEYDRRVAQRALQGENAP